MRKKLPVLDRVFDREADAPRAEKKKRPSVDAARARLGGRDDKAGSPPPGLGPGAYVEAIGQSGAPEVAVVVFANAEEAHVLLDGARLKKMPYAALSPRSDEPAGVLAKISADARVFAMLVEGQAVRYADDGGTLRAGNLVEKCRYGALVLRDDGAIVAVGFRKLWPVPTAGDA